MLFNWKRNGMSFYKKNTKQIKVKHAMIWLFNRTFKHHITTKTSQIRKTMFGTYFDILPPC